MQVGLRKLRRIHHRAQELLVEEAKYQHDDVHRYLQFVEDESVIKEAIRDAEVRNGIAILDAKLRVLRKFKQVWFGMMRRETRTELLNRKIQSLRQQIRELEDLREQRLMEITVSVKLHRGTWIALGEKIK